MHHGSLEKIAEYIEDSKKSFIEVLPPDVNESYVDFSVDKDKEIIRFGLGYIKNVGGAVSKNIVDERKKNGKYKDFYDFVERTKDFGVNKKTLESIIKSGAASSLGQNRATLLASYEEILSQKSYSQHVFDGQTSMFDVIEEAPKPAYKILPDLDIKEKLFYEKEMLGIYISGHPLKNVYKYLEKNINFNYKDYENIKENNLLKVYKNNEIQTAGLITKINKKISKKGNIIYIITIEDIFGRFDIILSESVFLKNNHNIEEGSLIGIKGKYVSRQEGDVSIFAENIVKIVFQNKK